MGYNKQNFEDNKVLHASQLNYIEKGIVDNETAISNKQDALISGQNIKTINGKSILGSGDLTITGGDGNIDLSGFATKGDLNSKADSDHTHEDLATKQDLNAKQNTLISGINIKTINGISLLGDGDIEIKGNAGSGNDAEDILLGTLPMEITEDFCYIISPTNATISTGEGVPQLLNFNSETVPYIDNPTYSSAIPEVVGTSTIRLGYDTAKGNKSISVDIPLPDWQVGGTYTMCFRLVDASDEVKIKAIKPYLRVQGGTTNQLSHPGCDSGDAWIFKSFTAEEAYNRLTLVVAYNAAMVEGSYFIFDVRMYQGAHTELPSGANFDILAETKYNIDGYKGSTLEAVNGETVYVYQIDVSNADIATDNGGVIFFGDSIMDFSNIPSMYSKRTGKPIINCSVGGTRMSDSRDEGNAYKPYDMASIANAIGTNNYTALIDGGKNAAFTTLATANIGGYKAIILEFGTNDFSAKVPFHGETTDTIEGALKFILRTLISKYPGIRIVVLSTLQYITIGQGNESGVPTHDDGTVWEMNEVIKEVCESDEFCVPFIDMYHKFGQNAMTRNYLNSDGVHLTSPYGVQRYLDILVGQLNALGI